MFLTEDETMMGQRHWSKYITLLSFAVGWAVCGRPQPKHKSVKPLLSLSPLNVLTH